MAQYYQETAERIQEMLVTNIISLEEYQALLDNLARMMTGME